MPYATDTAVPVERSQREIEQLVGKHGARSFYRGQDQGRAVVGFELADRRIQFEIPLPTPEDIPKKRGRHVPGVEQKLAQLERSRWRALAMVIKAKLISVETGVETMEEAFLAQVVVPHEGRAARFYDVARGHLAETYRTGKMPPLLPGGSPPALPPGGGAS